MLSPRTPNESGTVTAEFAVALPVIIGVLLFGLGQVRALVDETQLREDLAYVARALAREESEPDLTRWFSAQHPGVHIRKSLQSGILCVKANQTQSAKHCVWVGER
jgi:hypothetical protein